MLLGAVKGNLVEKIALGKCRMHLGERDHRFVTFLQEETLGRRPLHLKTYLTQGGPTDRPKYMWVYVWFSLSSYMTLHVT